MARSRTIALTRVRRVGLGSGALVTAGAGLLLGLVVAPPEAIQGEAQRLMYVHVPAAWTAFLAFLVVALASLDVWLRDSARRDAVARAAAELGVGMTALAILEGSLWGQAAWGVWWTWDPRLVTTAVLLVLYTGYLVIRALPGDPRAVRRRSALAGMLFFVQVPVVHFSVLWWRTLHQPPTLLAPEASPPIHPVMAVALAAGVLAFTLGGLWYVRRRSQWLLTVPSGPVRSTSVGTTPEPPEQVLEPVAGNRGSNDGVVTS